MSDVLTADKYLLYVFELSPCLMKQLETSSHIHLFCLHRHDWKRPRHPSNGSVSHQGRSWESNLPPPQSRVTNTHTWTSAFPFSSRSQSVTSNSFRISGSTELLRRLLSSSGLKPARLVWPPPQWRWEKRRLLRWSQISFLYSDPADWSLVSTRSSDSWNHLWTFRPEVKTFIHHWRQRDWNQQPADQPVRTTEAQSVQEQQRMNCVAIWPQISFYSPAAKNLNNVINKKKMDWIHSI